MSSINLLFVILLEIAALAYSQRNPGETCTANGEPGICKTLIDCRPVYQALLAGREPSALCGFKNFEPIVCCPNNASPKKPVTPLPPTPVPTDPPVTRRRVPLGGPVGSMARAKCAEYSEAVYQLVYPHTLSPNRTPVNVSVCAIKQKKLIVGGEMADPMEFPHMAAIGYNGGSEGIRWDCGGTLVSDKFVLTAAHCVVSPDFGGAVKIRVGDLNLIQTTDVAKPQERNIVERIKHYQYKKPAEYHDIALLKMDRPVEFDAFVRPACLPYSWPDVRIPQDRALATGWGRLDWSDDEGSADLLKVTLNLVDHNSCNTTYTTGVIDIKLFKGIVPVSQICAGQVGKDTCQGDSGGPLQVFNQDFDCMYTVIGVTSLGRYCGGPVPGVYTRVNNYIKWLEEKIWPDGI